MPGVKERAAAPSGSDMNVDHVPSQLTPTPDQAKHWMKAHRTMIASSTSSVFSTLSAVSLVPNMIIRYMLKGGLVSIRLDQDPHAGVWALEQIPVAFEHGTD